MKKGILLVNLGTPTTPTAPAVRTYLARFLADRRVITLPRWVWQPILHGMILPTRPYRSAALYRKIWTKQGSPLLLYTQKQAQQLQALLPQQVVRYAMCYSAPTVPTALQEMQQLGVTDLTVIPQYPQYSTTTVGSVFDQVAAFYMQASALPQLHFISSFYQAPQYIQALANQIKRALVRRPNAQLIFSYHGIPQKYADHGDPYPQQCTTTTQQVMALIGKNVPYSQSYQSKFGPGQWLRPATMQLLKTLPHQGVKDVVVITPGFVADCLETLQEIGHENRGYFMQNGGRSFTYLHPFNGSPTFTRLLATLAQS
ncbi:ferrochelatase [Loigolactobacillus binensis]|uniref:Coproporphyrin III ferrochelatase n=1 Tax=Loigolactobacillus binensis TaxID=2559922 RepID=A0ABW3EAK1_9LACO|nr:ferrochelatase [Loigolactobacillus binensis]